jgi:hypothetical protein
MELTGAKKKTETKTKVKREEKGRVIKKQTKKEGKGNRKIETQKR